MVVYPSRPEQSRGDYIARPSRIVQPCPSVSCAAHNGGYIARASRTVQSRGGYIARASRTVQYCKSVS